jgi:hypothetical protein
MAIRFQSGQGRLSADDLDRLGAIQHSPLYGYRLYP